MLAPQLPLADQKRLEALLGTLQRHRRYFVGYPCYQDFDYSALNPFLDFVVNNVGDPFGGSNLPMNTHEFERDVLNEFAELTRAPQDDWWGYVTSGGTEGNMYGLYVARELFPDGICYFSEDTHYSVTKILRLQHTRNIMLKSQPNGEMDYADLRETLRIHRDVPPIIFANIGTTMKGAMDNLATIRGILDELAISHSYIHADAALSGWVLPYVDEPPPWDFADGADSVCVSGHKVLGSPLPCGIVLARKHYVDRIARAIEYIGALDTTIAGSRSAIAPLYLWYRLRSLGRNGCREITRRSIELADYAISAMQKAGIDAWRHKNSITVVFPRPPDAVMKKWILAPRKDIVHIITLPHVSEGIIDEFVADYVIAARGESL